MSYFGQFVATWAQQRPNHVALHFQGTEYSYAWLNQQIHVVAEWLVAHDIKRADRVAYLGLNHPLMLVLLFALAKRGAILVPLNYRLTAYEHAQQLIDAEPKLLICDENFFDHANSLNCRVHELAELGETKHCAESDPVGTPADDLLLVYTSGTTGAAKGAVLTQNALLWNAINSIHAHDLTSQDRVLSVLPLFHVGGLNILTLPALFVGASVVLEARFDAGVFLKSVSRWRPSLTVLVPATISALLAHQDWLSTDLSCFRLVNTGSSIVPKAMLDVWHSRGVPAAQVYGSTETAPIAIYLRAEDTERKVGSAGLAALHCEAKLVAKNGLPCVANEVGEIYVRGPNVMRAYWRNSLASAEAFVADWFKTGDLAYQDSEGYFWVVGRTKELIISGGENIYPAEIESLILEHSDVAECAVVGTPDPRWGEVPVLVLVFKSAVSADRAAELIASIVALQLGDKLARYKWPKKTLALSALPKTALGKVKKDELKALL
jgi:fatty-acyl-CoA synthase